MDELLFIIRELINDLTRTLSSAMVHLDDLLLRINMNSDEYDDALMATDQLGRAFELFIELRWNYFLWINHGRYRGKEKITPNEAKPITAQNHS